MSNLDRCSICNANVTGAANAVVTGDRLYCGTCAEPGDDEPIIYEETGWLCWLGEIALGALLALLLVLMCACDLHAIVVAR